MSGERRALPARPSLRRLKLEAKRRLAAAEFSALHEAQRAIAREHGLASWPALTRLIASRRSPGHALAQLTWVISRFRDADAPSWAPPDERELLEHFDDRFLREVPPRELVATVAGMGPRLRDEITVLADTPTVARVQVDGVRIAAVAAAEPPHRLTGVRRFLTGARVTDRRLSQPPTRRSGAVPETAAQVAEAAFHDLGLVGLVLAGTGPGGVWATACGWADLERGEALTPGSAFPACEITSLVTATAVLRLAAGGRLRLDDPANGHLRAVRLADGDITVRELLSHTGGVDSPAPAYVSRVPAPGPPPGPTLPCGGPRGVFRRGPGGFAALGQLIADVTGRPFADAVARLVLRPLGMSGASFPASWRDAGRNAVAGHDLPPDGDGRVRPAPEEVCATPAAGGLWATAADLARFGSRWSSLLPAALAREALAPQAERAPAGHVGLGWLLGPSGDLAGEVGDGPGTAASLLVGVHSGRAHVALANRRVPIEEVNLQAFRAAD